MWNKRFIAVLFLLMGCSGSPPSPSVEKDALQVPTAWLCADTQSATSVSFQVKARVWRGAEVSQETVDAALLATNKVLRAYGGVLDVGTDPRKLADTKVISVTRADLKEFKPEDVQGQMQRSLRGLRDLVSRVAKPREELVNLLFLKEIVDPVGLGERILGDVMGLGISPELMERTREDSPSQAWLQAAGLDGDFTPTLIVSMRSIRGQGEQELGITLVHELGHALGLPHSEGGLDFMAEIPPPCIPEMTTEQRAAFERSPSRRTK